MEGMGARKETPVRSRNGALAVVANLVLRKEPLPSGTNHEELCRDDVHELPKILIRNVATIVCKNASTSGGQPNLCCIGTGPALADMHVNWLVLLVRPEEHTVSADSEQTRQP